MGQNNSKMSHKIIGCNALRHHDVSFITFLINYILTGYVQDGSINNYAYNGEIPDYDLNYLKAPSP